ncbi:MAG: flagellar motor protein MotB [Pseudomonadota bacterium]
MSGQGNAPVIIKRKKIVGGDGHHGGAWKVAYADFVTAMMAFFLLMWLLNATTESQRKGIADYFSPTIPLSRVSGGGEGSFGGESVFSESELAQNGTGGANSKPSEQNKARGNSGVNLNLREDTRAEDEAAKALEKLQQILQGQSGESQVSQLALKHVVTRLTDEGLVIEVFDLPDERLYGEDGRPTETLELLMNLFASVFGLVTNEIAVNGHVAAEPAVLVSSDAWEASAQRAQSAREMLQLRGLGAERFKRVTAFGDRAPAARNPMAARNNRLEFVLLRSDLLDE